MYVTSSNPTASVTVNVVEVVVPTTPTPTPPVKPGGQTATIELNPDVTNPDVTNPDVTNNEVFNPDVTNPDVTNPDVTNPDVTNPDVTNPDVTNVVVGNPDVTNPDVTNPDVTNPDVTNPDVTNPDVTNPDVTNGAYIDVTWTVKNTGNTAGSFSVKSFLSKNAPPGFKKQLLLYKRYSTPVTVTGSCTPKSQTQTVLLANITNPDVTNPDVTNHTEPSPETPTRNAANESLQAGATPNSDVTNPDPTNATLWLEPGDAAKITLRVLAPDKTTLVPKTVTQTDGTVQTVLVSPVFDTSAVAAPAVASQSVNTVDAQNGVTQPPVASPMFVTTASLPDAVTGVGYDFAVQATGGVPGPRVWSIIAGALPSGLFLDPATGHIFGTPALAGSASFSLRVSDTDAPANTNTADLFLRVTPLGIGQTVSTLQNQPASVTLSAIGAPAGSMLFAISTPPAHGAMSGIAPNVTYTPTAGYTGPDAFRFTATIATPFGPAISPEATIGVTVAAGINATPSFTAGAGSQVNEDAGPQSVSGWATNISAGPPSESAQVLDFLVSSGNPSLFSAGPAVSPSGTLTFTPAANANGSALVTVRIHDSGGTANGGIDTSAPQTFTIIVNAVNDAPSFTKGADQTVLESAGAQSVTGWATAISAGPADEAGQTLNFLVTPTNPALFSVAPAISATGTLTYTPAPSANGSTIVTVQLQDNGGTANGGVDTSAPQTFTIAVTPVNDVPSFTKGADQTVLEDAGAQIGTGLGDGDQCRARRRIGRSLNFLVTHGQPALFSAQPAISATGTLTFTPAANANGSSDS